MTKAFAKGVRDQARIRHQLSEAQTILSQQTGRPVTSLSYPYGDHNALTRRVAADLFQLAFAVDSGGWDWNRHRFAVRRLKIGPATTPARLKAMLKLVGPTAASKQPEHQLPEIKT